MKCSRYILGTKRVPRLQTEHCSGMLPAVSDNPVIVQPSCMPEGIQVDDDWRVPTESADEEISAKVKPFDAFPNVVVEVGYVFRSRCSEEFIIRFTVVHSHVMADDFVFPRLRS